MPPMERQVPDPLKQLSQKQAAEAKLLAAQQRQRSGDLKEHAKIREAKAEKKAAYAGRLKTPLAADPSGTSPNNQEQMPIQPRSHRLQKRQEKLHPRAPLGPHQKTQRSS